MVVTTREPGATELGAAIRQLVLHGARMDPHAEALLFAADRAQHVQTLVLPSLRRGAVVITDRYVDSSIAYQGGGRGFDPEGIDRISSWATSNLVPDLTIVLDLDPAVARKRMAAAGATPDRMESEDQVFHARVRQAFLARARRYPRRYLVIDATADPLDISEQIKAHLRKSLPAAPGGAKTDHSAPEDEAIAPTEVIAGPGDAFTAGVTTASASLSTSTAASAPAGQPAAESTGPSSRQRPSATHWSNRHRPTAPARREVRRDGTADPPPGSSQPGASGDPWDPP